MTSRRNSKRALLASIMSLVLCVTMLLGTTLAWFTDSVTNADNRIKSGSLGIDLLMDKGKGYVSIADGKGDIFGEATGNGILWEPGKTEIVFLQVANTGNLAVKYEMLLNIANETSDKYKLTDVLEYVVIDGMTKSAFENIYVATGYASWEEITKASGAQTGAVPEGEVAAAENGQLLAGDSDYFMLAVHMKEEAGNEYQNKDVTFDVQIDAIQLPYENDSFGSDYDANASVEVEEEEEPEGPTETVFDVVKNGKFDSAMSNWESVDGSCGSITEDNGNPCLIISDTDTEIKANQKYVKQKITLGTNNVNYTFKGNVKAETARANELAWVKVEFFGADGKNLSNGAYDKELYIGVPKGEWKEVSGTIPVPSTAASCNLMLRLLGKGTVCWDDVTFTYTQTVEDPNSPAAIAAAMAADFRDQLEAEASASQKITAGADPDYRIELPPMEGTPATLIANGDFESGLGSWTAFGEAHAPFGSLGEGAGRDGGNAMKFSATASDSTGLNPIYEQIIPIVGGAEYQVSFWYRVEKGAKVTPVVKLEGHGETVNGQVTGYGELTVRSENVKRDGEWEYVVGRFRTPTDSINLHVMARMMRNFTAEDQICYIDDVTVCMTQPSSILELETDQIFYYEEDKNANLTASFDTSLFPNLTNSKVDFQVYDGETLVWEVKDVQTSNGTATAAMSLAGLRKEVPYCVNATIYNADGTVADAKSQEFYVYSRPEYVTADGTYLKNGKDEFVPVFGYHVWLDDYEEAAAAGINVVQMGTFTEPIRALEYLDEAEKYGMMGLLCFYRNMKPSAYEDNMEKTLQVLSDERVINHPALFGYCIMDEPYGYFTEPSELMEDSYRLVRMMDDKHPILAVECYTWHYKDTGSRLDGLIIDPYYLAQDQGVYTSAVSAAEVMGDRPVYALVEAFSNETAEYRWPTPQDLRNNLYQALIGGTDSVGYFAISDSYKIKGQEENWPMWEAADGGALWNALVQWNTKEKDLAYDHFVKDNSPVFNQDIDLEDPYWYYSWVVGNDIYMVVLGMEKGQQVEAEIPLTSTNGKVSVGAYNATVIGGDEAAVSGEGTLKLTVDGVEAILYKITPTAKVNFSALQ